MVTLVARPSLIGSQMTHIHPKTRRLPVPVKRAREGTSVTTVTVPRAADRLMPSYDGSATGYYPSVPAFIPPPSLATIHPRVHHLSIGFCWKGGL